ncbi:MAG: hypothetical protein QM783_05945 [Phycisphaerales bacterium]
MADVKRKGGLDKRQRDIKVGAGLEEARYNVEFIDFLQRWGPTVMLVIAAVAMGFWGLQKWREKRDNQQGVAFGDLDQAMYAAPGMDVNPDVLVRIAEDNAGQGAVPVLARLRAAEQWRDSAMKGYKPGAALDPKTRGVVNQDDVLTAEGKSEFLEKAKAQYKLVIDQTAGNFAKATFTLTAYMGTAAIAETQAAKGNTQQLQQQYIAEAKAAYTSAKELAEKAHFPEYAALATKRIETVEKYAQPAALLPESLVASWDKPAPVPPALPGGSLLSPNGLTPGSLTPTTPLPGSTPDPFKIDIPGTTPGTNPASPTPPATPAVPPAIDPTKPAEPKQP